MKAGLPRRDFLAWLIVLTGAGGLWYSFALGPRRTKGTVPTAGRRGNNPRRRTRVKPFATSLPTGLYVNPKSQVVHFVSSAGVVCSVARIIVGALQPIPASAVSAPREDAPRGTAPQPRVKQGCASIAFESLALARIEGGQIDLAGDLLLTAIDYDLTRVRYGYSPSYRLYDLLAILSVRFRRPSYLEKMREKIQSAPTQQMRVQAAKWQNPQSAWHRKWSNTKTRKKWARLLM